MWYGAIQRVHFGFLVAGKGVGMSAVHERFVTDKDGRRIAVLLGMDEYAKLLQELEELESLKAYDAAKSTQDEAIPLEQALAEIEKTR